ncbi:MAG: tetratricopeptide repeat protein, partial [Planctomycetota bacterium]
MRISLRAGLAAPVIVAATCLCGSGQAARAAAAPSTADDAWRAAGNLFARGRYPEASEGYAAFADEFAKDARAPEARFRSGEALFRAGLLEESLKRFRALRDDARAALREANVLYLTKRPEKAVAKLREMLAREGLPASLEGPARYFLARSLLSLGRPDEARKAVEKAPKAPKPARACLKLALGDVEAAAYLAGKKKGAGDAGRLEAALAAYRDALEKDAGGGRLAPEILFGIGELLRRSGRAKEAIEHYRRVAEEHASSPVAPYARLGLSWAALGRGDFDGAAREAKRSGQKAREGGPLAAEARYAEGTAHLAAK